MIAWAVETAVAGTWLMLLVLVVRRPVAHLFGAGWAYALWLLPALRFVLPPLPWTASQGSDAILAPVAQRASVAAPASGASAMDWKAVLIALWLAGAAVILLHQFLSYRRLLARLGIGRSVRAGLDHEVGIIESRHVDGPLAIGLLDRWIVVPADFTSRYGPAEQRLALAHERTHHRREDIAWNMAALVLLAFNWFNPVAWIAFRAFRMDQELSCDAAVAAAAPPGERHLYASALVKSASAPGLIAACPLNHADQLKRRLKMMKHHRRTTARTIGGAATLAALMIGGIATTASAAQDKPEAKTERRVIIKRVDGKTGERSEDVLVEGRSLAELEDKCEGVKSESDVTTGDGADKQRTRIVMCAKDDANPAQVRERLIAGLEKAKAELSASTEGSAEHRTRAVAHIDKEIARLKAGN